MRDVWGGSLFSAGWAARKAGKVCVGFGRVIHGREEEGAERAEQDGWRETVKGFGGCCRWFQVVKVPLIVTSQGMKNFSSTLDLSTWGRHAWESFGD